MKLQPTIRVGKMVRNGNGAVKQIGATGRSASSRPPVWVGVHLPWHLGCLLLNSNKFSRRGDPRPGFSKNSNATAMVGRIVRCGRRASGAKSDRSRA